MTLLLTNKIKLNKYFETNTASRRFAFSPSTQKVSPEEAVRITSRQHSVNQQQQRRHQHRSGREGGGAVFQAERHGVAAVLDAHFMAHLEAAAGGTLVLLALEAQVNGAAGARHQRQRVWKFQMRF
jgi:hypothetical protein